MCIHCVFLLRDHHSFFKLTKRYRALSTYNYYRFQVVLIVHLQKLFTVRNLPFTK
jgi:hypothetical protein